MSKLPLGKCARCNHDLWDNEADFKGTPLERVKIVCVYCGEILRYDILGGKYIKADIEAMSPSQQLTVLQAKFMQKLVGPEKLMKDEHERRNKEKKTS